MNKRILHLFLLILLVILPFKATAKQNPDLGSGKIDKIENLELLEKYYTIDEIDDLNPIVKRLLTEENNTFNKTEFIITDTYYDSNGNVLIEFNRISTLEEALKVRENQKKNPSRGVVNSNVHETNSKMVGVTSAWDYGSGYWRTDVVTYWFTTPIVKSYDIIAARWTNPYFSIDHAVGAQEYSQNNSIINYSYLGNNMVSLSQGVGISMNLVDNGSDFILALTIYSNNTPITVYATYQHATTNISLNTSKSYTFVTNPSNGLGGVLNHTYPNYFDNMMGVTITPQ